LYAVVAIGILVAFAGGAWHLARIQAELDRSNQLVSEGNDFAQWVLGDYIRDVGRLAGSTEAQQALVARLQQYLEGLAAQAHDDSVLAATIARAYLRIAEVQGNPESFNLGDTAGALENCLKAEAFYRRALQDNRDDPELKLAHINCQRMIVQLRQALGQPQEAVELLGRLREELQPIARQVEDPERIEMLDNVLLADLAWLHLEAGKTELAQQEFEQAHRTAAAIAERFPQQQMFSGTVRVLRNHLTQMYQHLGQYDKAFEHSQWLVERARAESANNPTDVLSRQELALALLRHGDVLSFLNRNEEALAAYREVEAIRRAVLAVDPKNARTRSELVACLDRISSVYMAQQDFDSARPVLNQAIALHAALLKQDPQNVEHRRTFWILHNSLGILLMHAGAHDEAKKMFEQSLAVEQELLKENSARTPDHQGMAETCHGLAQECFSRSLSANDPVPDLKQSLDWLDRSLAAYREIEQRGPLSAVQENRRQAVLKMQKIIADALQALQQ
jgi:tetratricopeptide (TPR) repeat protein